ncbi:hypothetical protein OG462_02135 [Streptomyces sp. NBC_01077]|uniref:hypothetical protein n=1 Tax=Streptomyces sp. NBC_01077 TaxID=2903746 RepID=UPI0038664A1D|nr:hypothetical protein OG462_02135 [Streptomyces sp. NBC_01077]
MVVTSLYDPIADVVISELHDRDVPVVQLDWPTGLPLMSSLAVAGRRRCSTCASAG